MTTCRRTRIAVHGLAAIAILALGMSLAHLARAESSEIVPFPADQTDDRLASALEQYRAIDAAGGWPAIPFGPSLREGQTGIRVAALRLRLTSEAYLAHTDNGSAADPPDRFGADLAAAVRDFQRRHGLAEDGVVGPATLRALNVPAHARLAQIELNLARLRASLPWPTGRYVAINLADQRLELVEDGAVTFVSKVIVGKPSSPTPLLASLIEAVVFNPPWNVPASIAAKEILPRVRHDPGYLARENMVIVGRRVDPRGLAIDWRAAPLASYATRIRQLPGPRNALGQIKFEFPSPYGVYLHDTPDRRLFERPRRLFSHGCMRVQRARELAAALLREQGWNAAEIEATINAAATRTVPLQRHVPIRVLYLTVFMDMTGAAQFRDDAYHWDRPEVPPVMPEPGINAAIASQPGGCGG